MRLTVGDLLMRGWLEVKKMGSPAIPLVRTNPGGGAGPLREFERPYVIDFDGTFRRDWFGLPDYLRIVLSSRPKSRHVRIAMKRDETLQPYFERGFWRWLLQSEDLSAFGYERKRVLDAELAQLRANNGSRKDAILERHLRYGGHVLHFGDLDAKYFLALDAHARQRARKRERQGDATASSDASTDDARTSAYWEQPNGYHTTGGGGVGGRDGTFVGPGSNSGESGMAAVPMLFDGGGFGGAGAGGSWDSDANAISDDVTTASDAISADSDGGSDGGGDSGCGGCGGCGGCS